MHTRIHAHHLCLHLLSTARAHPEACHLASARRWFSFYLSHLLQVSYHSQVTNLEPTNLRTAQSNQTLPREPNLTPCLVPSTEPRRPHQLSRGLCVCLLQPPPWTHMGCCLSLHHFCEGSSCFWCSYRPYQHSKWVSKQRGGELVGNTEEGSSGVSHWEVQRRKVTGPERWLSQWSDCPENSRL